jgi:ATP phosphoribosyltransferase regulatory subunit
LPTAILAPAENDPALAALVTQLRGEGHIVVQALPGVENAPRAPRCDRRILKQHGRWEVAAMGTN